MLTKAFRQSFRPVAIAALICAVASVPLHAQTPLSAIDWLSDSLTTPAPDPNDTIKDDPISGALPEDVTVSTISGPAADAVGLLASNVTGLPANLWGASGSYDLAGRITNSPIELYPAMQDLLNLLLLAELDPPRDSSGRNVLFLARIDHLLAIGALEEAQAMLDLAGQVQPEIFRRSFDVALLLRTENRACETLRLTPDLSPTFPARVFCLARGGDWDAAALSLETGRALGYLTDFEDALLARFLDPSIGEGLPRLFVPPHPSPLVFRLLEAIGEPLPTANLPRAFAHADLHANTGWKAQLEAAERLVRTGGVPANLLSGLYLDGQPAASGGVWERVKRVQELESALANGQTDGIEVALSTAWEAMVDAELEMPFVEMFSHRLEGLELRRKSAELVLEIRLLSADYEAAAEIMPSENPHFSTLRQIASGHPGTAASVDAQYRAIQDGFRMTQIPARFRTLTRADRLGEAILRAIELFTEGANGNHDELADAIGFFRTVGLENVARRAALQVLLLDRRG